MSEHRGWLPKSTPETAPFWEGCHAGRLMMPRCKDCRSWIWYPRPFCPACQGWNIEWLQASGKGTLYTFTIVHKASRGWEDRAPYVLAMADLAEGPRLTAILDMQGEKPQPEGIRIGSDIIVGFEKMTEAVSFPVFRMVQS